MERVQSLRLLAYRPPAGRHSGSTAGELGRVRFQLHAGRFGRMFPFSGNILPDQCLRDIAQAVAKGHRRRNLQAYL